MVARSFYARRGLALENLRLEFGRYKNRMVLGDELSLDTCQLLEEKSGDKVFPGRSSSDAAALLRIYRELGARILSANG